MKDTHPTYQKAFYIACWFDLGGSDRARNLQGDWRLDMRTQNKDQLTQAKYSEWLASLFGACFVAFALGVWLNELFDSMAWVVLIVGVALHSWGM